MKILDYFRKQRLFFLKLLYLGLIIGISFNLGRLSVLLKLNNPAEIKVSKTNQTRLTLKLLEIKDKKLVFWTNNENIAKVGEEVLAIKDGQFEVDLNKIGELVVYNHDQEINFGGLDPAKFNLLVAGEADAKTDHSQDSAAVSQQVDDQQLSSPSEKRFVGSKNSNKYHPPDCRWAKQIKPENQIWFSSHEEAKAKGYTPSSCFDK